MRRHVLDCVFLVSAGAVVVLICRSVLLLAHLVLALSFNNSPSTPTNFPVKVREAAVLAVHVHAPVSRDPVERVAVAQLARANGTSFTTVAAAAVDGTPREADSDKDVELETFVVCENDARAPLSSVEIENWLGNPGLTTIDALRDVEREILAPGFDTFSGIYGAAVKARALRLLAESDTLDRIWILEPDVVFTGEWRDFFKQYDGLYPDQDLIAANSTDATGGPSWPHAKSCTLCGDGEQWYTAFLPVFRVSKRLARAVVAALKRNVTGHHEAFIPTVCSRMPGCKWAPVVSNGGVFRYRPVVDATEATRQRKPGRLFHPVKTAPAFRALVE